MGPLFEDTSRDVWWRVDDIAAVAAVRRAASAAADGLGFSAGRVAEVGIVASELATNLVRHAGGGDLVLRTTESGEGPPQLRLLALDSGPGRRNIRAMMADGASSIGTLGIGLGACRRIANHFDVFSVSGTGTIVELLIRDDQGDALATPRVDLLTRPLTPEAPCGDDAAFRVVGDRTVLLLADGLGHGTLAAEASRRAVQILEEHAQLPPAALLDHAHRALAGTRGAAISVLAHDASRGELVHAGVGNVATRLVSATRSQTLAPQPGIVGHRMPRVQEVRHQVGDMRTAVMHSDGISQRWTPEDLEGTLAHTPGTVCATLMRTASGRDDASVIAMRLAG